MATAELISAAMIDSVQQDKISQADRNDKSVLASEINDSEKLVASWEAIRDAKLIEWGREAGSFHEEGLVPPTRDAIQKACEFVKFACKAGWPLPTGVVPDGEGGIVFENKLGSHYERIEIDEHGSMSFVIFQDCTLVSRIPVEVETN